jgi:hypothetical protein
MQNKDVKKVFLINKHVAGHIEPILCGVYEDFTQAFIALSRHFDKYPDEKLSYQHDYDITSYPMNQPIENF